MKKIIEKIKELFAKVNSLFLKGKEKEKDVIASVNAGGDAVSSDTFVKTNLSEGDMEATKAAQDELIKNKNKKKKRIKIIVITIIAIVAFIIIFNLIRNNIKKNADMQETMKNVSSVKVMNISSEISGSGTLAPKDSYTITSLVEGNVTNVFFEMGDKVIKDQLLLTIDSSTAYRNIENASTSIAQARDNYKQAKYEYEKVEKDYAGRSYRAPFTGSLRTFTVKAGDKLKNNQEIGTIVDDSVMTVKVPFGVAEASSIHIGDIATLELQETGEFLTGTVKSIAEEKQSINSGSLVKYVTIRCKNPGGLTTDNTAIAYIGNSASVEDAAFELETNEKLVFNDGSDVEVEKLLVSEGAYVKEGTPLFLITEDTINNIITNKKRSYLQAKESLTKAENSYDDYIDAYDEYFITSPIDGTVITKDVKVGDKIQRNNSNVKTLCTVYDLSELSFKMDVDELDITKIKNGQKVNIQADAFNNKMFNGEITNISLVAANSNGVTNYPVTVTITDIGELLPGMNVDAYVILSHADNVLAIPADALQRGDVVYVLNSSPTIKEKKYSTEGITDRVKARVPEGFTAVKVEAGISNDNFIEIKSGLKEGDQVYVNESSANNMFNFRGMGGPGGFGGGRQGNRR